MCNVVTFAHGQANSELDKPYLTKEGVFYRDVLTVASAKGVAQFAKSYQRQQRGLVKQNNSNHRASLSYDYYCMYITYANNFFYLGHLQRKNI